MATIMHILITWFIISIPVGLVVGQMLKNGLAQPQAATVQMRRELPSL